MSKEKYENEKEWIVKHYSSAELSKKQRPEISRREEVTKRIEAIEQEQRELQRELKQMADAKNEQPPQ